jgi:hypothetical protein
MKRIRNRRLGWVTAAVAAVAVATLVATVGAGASVTTHVTKRPHAARRSARARLRGAAGIRMTTTTPYPVRQQIQEFGANTTDFCPGPPNNPCDGNPNNGDYGTIDRVSGGFSNGGFGNYAPSTPAFAGKYMAVVSGDADVNQGAGCPQPNTVEYCTGPFALFGTGAAEGAENVFPSTGFTVTDDLYLSPSSNQPTGQLVDNDVELNNSSGSFGIDNVITSCYNGTGYVVNFGNNSPGSCAAGNPVISSDGWYRFVWVFSNVAGSAYVTMSVLSEPSLTTVATSGPQPVGGSVTPISTWGGPGYLWFPTEDISGLPLANFAVVLGQHTSGYTPSTRN